MGPPTESGRWRPLDLLIEEKSITEVRQFGAPAGLRPSNPEDLHWLVQKDPFPDAMLLLMEEALEGHGDAGNAPVGYTTLDADRLRAGMDVQEVPAMHDRFR